MDAALRAARVYALSRIAAGATLTASPHVATPWLADHGSRGAVRLLGERDVALGALALADPATPGWRRTMLWCAAADAVDVAVAVQRARLGYRRAWLAALAGAIGCSVGVALAAARPSGRP